MILTSPTECWFVYENMVANTLCLITLRCEKVLYYCYECVTESSQCTLWHLLYEMWIGFYTVVTMSVTE